MTEKFTIEIEGSKPVAPRRRFFYILIGYKEANDQIHIRKREVLIASVRLAVITDEIHEHAEYKELIIIQDTYDHNYKWNDRQLHTYGSDF